MSETAADIDIEQVGNYGEGNGMVFFEEPAYVDWRNWRHQNGRRCNDCVNMKVKFFHCGSTIDPSMGFHGLECGLVTPSPSINLTKYCPLWKDKNVVSTVFMAVGIGEEYYYISLGTRIYENNQFEIKRRANFRIKRKAIYKNSIDEWILFNLNSYLYNQPASAQRNFGIPNFLVNLTPDPLVELNHEIEECELVDYSHYVHHLKYFRVTFNENLIEPFPVNFNGVIDQCNELGITYQWTSKLIPELFYEFGPPIPTFKEFVAAHKLRTSFNAEITTKPWEGLPQEWKEVKHDD